MASGWTNKGKARVLEIALANGAEPTSLYLALVTSAVAPSPDTNVFSSLTEITAGSGYVSGGIALTRNGTNFPVVENDTDDRGDIDIPDQAWTASGGAIPASGAGARWAVLTDDNATIANREVWYWFDLSSDRSVSDTQTITLQNLLIRLT
jgi:hypothetical protein